MTLCLHMGARNASLDAVNDVTTPPATSTHQPIPHAEVINTTKTHLANLNWQISDEQYALWGDASEMMFGVISIALNDGHQDHTLTVGLRNSHNKRFSVGLTAGSRVFVCDNLAFSGDIVVLRRHTPNIVNEYSTMFARGILQMFDYDRVLGQRFDAFKATKLNDTLAHDFIIKGLLEEVITTTQVQQIVQEWHEPSYPDFADDRNVWRLFNGFTHVMKGQNPTTLRKRTEHLEVMAELLATQEATNAQVLVPANVTVN